MSQVDGDHALIEAAVILVLARLIVPGIGDVADLASVKRSGVRKERQPMQVYTSPFSSSIFFSEM